MVIRKVGIIGSGDVGKALARGFAGKDYDVMIGSRNPDKLEDFLKEVGDNIRAGSFKETAEFGDMILLCTSGVVVENAVKLAGKKNFEGKIVIDVTNPLKVEKEGEAPKLAFGYPDSGGKKLQEMIPGANVVKAFNSVTSAYMCNPKLSEGSPDMFIAGDDKMAKEKVSRMIEDFGWSVIDIGGIEQSYLLESLAMIWIRYGFLNNHWTHAFKLLRS